MDRLKEAVDEFFDADTEVALAPLLPAAATGRSDLGATLFSSVVQRAADQEKAVPTVLPRKVLSVLK